jgi:hypothetical protein
MWMPQQIVVACLFSVEGGVSRFPTVCSVFNDPKRLQHPPIRFADLPVPRACE